MAAPGSYTKAQALLEKGVSRPTLYTVRLPQQWASTRVNDYIEFYCKATAIPSMNFGTATVLGQEHMGIVRDQPISVVYSKPFTMTILESTEFEVYKSLREWMEAIGTNVNNPTASSTSGRSQKMNYYSTYVADLELIKLEQPDQEGQTQYKQPLKVTFINAYPVNIGEVVLGSDQYDAQTEFQIQFNYESYNIEDGVNE